MDVNFVHYVIINQRVEERNMTVDIAHVHTELKENMNSKTNVKGRTDTLSTQQNVVKWHQTSPYRVIHVLHSTHVHIFVLLDHGNKHPHHFLFGCVSNQRLLCPHLLKSHHIILQWGHTDELIFLLQGKKRGKMNSNNG